MYICNVHYYIYNFLISLFKYFLSIAEAYNNSRSKACGSQVNFWCVVKGQDLSPVTALVTAQGSAQLPLAHSQPCYTVFSSLWPMEGSGLSTSCHSACRDLELLSATHFSRNYYCHIDQFNNLHFCKGRYLILQRQLCRTSLTCFLLTLVPAMRVAAGGKSLNSC